VLRGPSAAGKSTVAAELARQCPDKTAILEEDYFRRVILQRRDDDRAACRRMLRDCSQAALDAGFHVVLEGILATRHYGPVIADLLGRKPGVSFLFYFDVSLAETLNRHQSKSIADVVPESSLRDWYGAASPLCHPAEMIIPETCTVQQAVRLIQATTGLAIGS
jgi:predicted kinase